MSFVRLAFDYLSHQAKAVNEHGVHSPFLFKLLTESIYNKSINDDHLRIERIRKNCLQNNMEIDVVDLGAGSRLDGKGKRRSVRFICKSFSKNRKLCGLLYQTVKHLKPEVTVELGTSLGISSMYLATGFKAGVVYTIEGCPNTSEIARKHFKEAGMDNLISLTGNFDDKLPTLLKDLGRFDCMYIDGNHTFEATTRYFETLLPHIKNNSFVIFDDIHWSKDMTRAWEKIIAHERVTMSVDFFHLGMVFFEPGFSKENFRIRF
ncbi:MAG: hypothetical protein RL090_781 [Bacteroidota bacterium]